MKHELSRSAIRTNTTEKCTNNIYFINEGSRLGIHHYESRPRSCGWQTIVSKAAEKTPLLALRVIELIMEADFPQGVINVVLDAGKSGCCLAQQPNAEKAAYMGSTESGYYLMRTS
uniref:Aldehyde dehydrogenase domain-containing protein n=1 Tax=Peronospora matthiolae TaxID=2874970 RepID=A0AAV1TE47_9STRA